MFWVPLPGGRELWEVEAFVFEVLGFGVVDFLPLVLWVVGFVPVFGVKWKLWVLGFALRVVGFVPVVFQEVLKGPGPGED